MSDSKIVNSYAGAMANLQSNWPKLTPDERRVALQSIVNDVAKKAHFPPPNVKMDPSLGIGRNGELHFQTWDIAINPALASKPALSNEEMTTLSDTIFHETRHAEQWWLVIRRDAAEGLTPEQMITKRHISNIAVVKAAAKAPLPKDAPTRACADIMYESIYGKDAAARGAKLRALSSDGVATRAALTKTRASEKAYRALAEDPNATKIRKTTALEVWQDDYNAWVAAKRVSDASYANYRALPEEADAWNAGGRAGKATADVLNQRKLP